MGPAYVQHAHFLILGVQNDVKNDWEKRRKVVIIQNNHSYLKNMTEIIQNNHSCFKNMTENIQNNQS